MMQSLTVVLVLLEHNNNELVNRDIHTNQCIIKHFNRRCIQHGLIVQNIRCLKNVNTYIFSVRDAFL